MWRMYESAGQIRNLLGRKIKMKIRKLETGEKLNTRKLYEEVFSEDSKDFVDYYYTSVRLRVKKSSLSSTHPTKSSPSHTVQS